MLDEIGEAGFKDTAGDGFEWGLEAEVSPFPELFFAALEEVERFGVCGGEADAAVGAEDLDEPGVGGSGLEAFHFKAHGDRVAFDSGPGVE